MRVPALVAGGYLPDAVRGTTQHGLIHIADVYATLLGLAGVDPIDHNATAAGVPQIDSLDVWPLLSGTNTTSPRVEIPISAGALVAWPYKLVRGLNWWSGYTGPVYPNASSPGLSPDIWVDCGTGCLYNLESDATESVNLAAQQPDLVASLGSRLDSLVTTFWTNADVGVDACPANITMWCGCWAAIHTYGGFLGPYQH